MDKTLKTKWLRALRGGKYKQGKGVLRSAENKFCCLGVLLDVMDKKAWPKTTDCVISIIQGVETEVECYVAGDKGTGLDYDTRHRIRLPHSVHADLVCMNDSGKSFRQIASHIESTVLSD